MKLLTNNELMLHYELNREYWEIRKDSLLSVLKAMLIWSGIVFLVIPLMVQTNNQPAEELLDLLSFIALMFLGIILIVAGIYLFMSAKASHFKELEYEMRNCSQEVYDVLEKLNSEKQNP